jgi:hypothetical protein
MSAQDANRQAWEKAVLDELRAIRRLLESRQEATRLDHLADVVSKIEVRR